MEEITENMNDWTKTDVRRIFLQVKQTKIQKYYSHVWEENYALQGSGVGWVVGNKDK